MSEEMDEGSRNDDASAELPQDGDEDVVWRDEAGQENGTEDTNGAGCQHGKQETDSETDVVVPVDPVALCGFVLVLITTSAVFNTSMKVAFPFAGRGCRFTLMVVVVIIVLLVAFFGFLGYE